jgi:putative transposase
MYFDGTEFYHVYNRGNNKQLIFFNDRNYLFFLRKISEQILPFADIFAYCLMPNHFHLLIRPNEGGLTERNSFGGKPMQELSYRLGMLLSSYAQAINKQNKTSGSLFQQKTKAKILSETDNGTRISYFEQCFHYIHNNPVAAGIVQNPEEWPYSSYPDYAGLTNGTLCSRELFYSNTGLNPGDMSPKIAGEINEKILEKIF